MTRMGKWAQQSNKEPSTGMPEYGEKGYISGNIGYQAKIDTNWIESNKVSKIILLAEVFQSQGLETDRI